MAVVSVAKRAHVLKWTNGSLEIGNLNLSGTYVQGGFTTDMRGLTGNPGSSPYGGAPLRLQCDSTVGALYSTTFGTGATSQIATTKIFVAGAELAAGALPETVVPFALTRRYTI